MARFAGKVAIVTGAAQGIGAAIAARLAAESAHIVIADINEPGDPPRDSFFVRADVSSGADVANVVEATLARWGRLDVLVNNAGLGSLGETPEIAEEHWDRIFGVNIKAIFLLSKAAVPALRETSGSIVNIASISGLAGDHAMAAYNASKGAVINYTRALAIDCAKDAIRVNAVCPGLIATDLAASGIADPEDREFWFGRIPMGRAGKPEEIAALVAFLASDEASYMTGSIVVADGGVTAHTGQPNFKERIALRAERAAGKA